MGVSPTKFPRPTYPTDPNFSLSAVRDQISWVKCPYAKMKFMFGAGLESGLIKSVARTAGIK